MGASVVDEVLVVDVQRFSLHDGPGIRTTVFLGAAFYLASASGATADTITWWPIQVT